MREMPVLARFPPLQSSLLVTIFMQRTVHVCLPPNSGLAWQADKSQLASPGPSPAFDTLPFCILRRVLTISVTIGRARQTR
jgi:hypothetical protein